MSRRRKTGRRRRNEITLHLPPEPITLILKWSEDDDAPVRLTVPGVTRPMFEEVTRLSGAGELQHPLIREFCLAFSSAVLAAEGTVYLGPWTAADDRGVLETLGLVPVQPADSWTASDDEAVRALLNGGHA